MGGHPNRAWVTSWCFGTPPGALSVPTTGGLWAWVMTGATTT